MPYIVCLSVSFLPYWPITTFICTVFPCPRKIRKKKKTDVPRIAKQLKILPKIVASQVVTVPGIYIFHYSLPPQHEGGNKVQEEKNKEQNIMKLRDIFLIKFYIKFSTKKLKFRKKTRKYGLCETYISLPSSMHCYLATTAQTRSCSCSCSFLNKNTILPRPSKPLLKGALMWSNLIFVLLGCFYPYF